MAKKVERYSVYMDIELKKKIQKTAKENGLGISEFILACINEFYDREETESEIIFKRLGHHKTILDKIEKKQETMIQTMALSIWYELAILTTGSKYTENEKEVMIHQADQRYQKF